MLDQEHQKSIEVLFALSQGGENILRLGMIIMNGDQVSDILSVLPEPNKNSLYKIDFESDIEDTLDLILRDLLQKRNVFLHIKDFLPPKIYSQLYLFSREGRMDFIDSGGQNMSVDIPEEAVIIVLIDKDDFDSLNYKNMHDLINNSIRLN